MNPTTLQRQMGYWRNVMMFRLLWVICFLGAGGIWVLEAPPWLLAITSLLSLYGAYRCLRWTQEWQTIYDKSRKP